MNQRTSSASLGRATRRDLFKFGGLGLAAASLGACDLLSTDPADSRTGRKPSTGPKGKEAPALAELVKKGDLPPVEERLPKEPMVLEPIDDIGQYGGERNLLMLRGEVGGASDRLNTTIGYEHLVRWKPGAEDLTNDQVIPNVAKDFQINADGAEYVSRCAKG